MAHTHPLWQHIRTVPNFPKDGIDFYDITPLLDGHLDTLTDHLVRAVPSEVLTACEYLCAIESRGFILATLLATHTKKPLILIRKAGKLPPPVHRFSYELEYGADTLEMTQSLDSKKVLLVDDVLATGGTLKATYELCQMANHHVLGALVLLDLPKLHDDLAMPVYRILST